MNEDRTENERGARALTRRELLAAGIGVGLGAGPWRAPRSASQADVLVIGAGAAGLAATEALLERGRSVITLEAASRIGGRAHTDRALFGVPYDFGAHWLHNASGNPFVSYAKKNGFHVYPAPGRETLHVGSREASGEEYEAYQRAYGAALGAISEAGRRGKDVSPASVVPDGGVWHDLVHFAIGPWEMGKDFDDFSCQDWWSGEEGSDWFCTEGYGTLVAHSAKSIPVALSTKAHTVRWDTGGVSVETHRGTLRASACIITVSTGVLASGDLRFIPPLPVRKQEAFHAISMGLYNHIALQFGENFLGTEADEYLVYRPDSHGAHSPRMMGLLTNISGTPLSFGDVGGDFARELEQEGQRAAIDFGLSELRKIFGAQVDRHFVRGHSTAWGKNPLTQGSYASARPGAFALRSVLREPVGERLWFAGEACSYSEWATVAGARETGLRVGKEVADTLAAL